MRFRGYAMRSLPAPPSPLLPSAPPMRHPKWLFWEGAPEQFLCAITGQLMRDPVATADGHIYERPACQAPPECICVPPTGVAMGAAGGW
jgi:hypothetical protein